MKIKINDGFVEYSYEVEVCKCKSISDIQQEIQRCLGPLTNQTKTWSCRPNPSPPDEIEFGSGDWQAAPPRKIEPLVGNDLKIFNIATKLNELIEVVNG
jgi:hypothetical protein